LNPCIRSLVVGLVRADLGEIYISEAWEALSTFEDSTCKLFFTNRSNKVMLGVLYK
jgi:hypothetical protein